MAIVYQLKFAEHVPTGTLVDLLEIADFKPTSSPRVLAWPGLTATVGPSQDRFGVWRAGVGVDPVVEVFFDQEKTTMATSLERSRHQTVVVEDLLDTVALLLGAVGGDAVLVAEHEVVLTHRVGGELVLSDREWWAHVDEAPTCGFQGGGAPGGSAAHRVRPLCRATASRGLSCCPSPSGRRPADDLVPSPSRRCPGQIDPCEVGPPGGDVHVERMVSGLPEQPAHRVPHSIIRAPDALDARVSGVEAPRASNGRCKSRPPPAPAQRWPSERGPGLR